MQKLTTGVVAVAVAVFSAARVLQEMCLALRCVCFVDGNNFAGREMMEMTKIRRRSGDESQKITHLVGNEELGNVSDTDAKLHILVAVAVAKDLLAAKADALMSKCHGSDLVVRLALLAAVEKQDGPIRSQEVLVAMQNRAAVEAGAGVEMAAEAAARDQGRRGQVCSSNQQVVNSHEITPE